VVDKVQDRGEDVVYIVEAQREDIMENLVDIHDTLQRMHMFTVITRLQCSIQKRHNNPLCEGSRGNNGDSGEGKQQLHGHTTDVAS
jgi:hypothetical protein